MFLLLLTKFALTKPGKYKFMNLFILISALHLTFKGGELSLLWALPFVGMILSLALFPMILPHFWKRNYGTISFFWSLATLISIFIFQGLNVCLATFASTMIYQFIPFIIVLLAMYAITGGIELKGKLMGTPNVNLIILIIGFILSSWIGTTGASVLLIRPLLQANAWRKYKVHTIIFFIFIVGNIGGSLTPIGNPPLLMGFINKIPFFWPLTNLLMPTLLSSFLILSIYFVIEFCLYKKENYKPITTIQKKLTVEGKWNILLILLAIIAIIISGKDFGNAFYIVKIPVPWSELIEIMLLSSLIAISLTITPKKIRVVNKFTWHPIAEVGKLFAGIFICMAPIIAMLEVGKNGPLGNMMNSLSTPDGQPLNSMYFWLSGGLSAFLDSAPAYLIFFNTATAPSLLLEIPSHVFMTMSIPNTLLAITLGASFMGAITYIGNAPNLMIKSMAEENHVKMPSFFGYMLWSILILVPIFLLVQFLFILK